MSTHSHQVSKWARTALSAGILCAFAATASVSAEEHGPVNTLLSSTTVGGYVLTSATFTQSPPGTTGPTVRLLASDPFALVGTSTGAFTLVRRETNEDLAVDIKVGGTATGGVDYQAITNPIVIPAGLYSVDVIVQPLPDAPASAHNKTVMLTLQPSTNYTILSGRTAEVDLVEQLYNDPAPVVTITAPVDGSSLSGTNLTITATASDNPETITKVTFFADDDQLGSSTNAPYSFTWTNAPIGKHVLFAKAVNSIGQAGLSTAVNITVTNGSPGLAITSPADGATLLPGNVTITADSSAGGAVRFTINGHPLGTVAQAPYVYVWSNAIPGHYQLQATTGDHGSLLKSEPVNIVVKDTAPTVAITAPTNNATFGPTAITFAADVTAGDEPLQRVSFWVDERLIGIVTNAPYGVTWSNPSAGKHTAVARAVDTFGVVADSAPVKFSVTNTPPTVSLTAPADQSTYVAPAQITLTADAADTDGTIARVTFWANNRLIGTATSSPYTITWNHVAPGAYAITAHAVDNSGATTASAPVAITVTKK